MRILFIHGIAQGGRDPDELKKIWTETLQERYFGTWPKTLKIDFPYYGNLLDDLVAKSKLPTPEDVVTKGPGQDAGFETFLQSALGDMREAGRIPQAEVDAHLDAAPAVEKKGLQNWRIVRAIAQAIDARFTKGVSFNIEHFLKEVYVYVERPAAQRRIDAIVEAMLTREPTIVIGHSLGSVVAYNVVRHHRAALDLRAFITVGSPLGLRAVSSKLGVLENSSGKAGWYNAFDPTDIVALRPLDSDWFKVDPEIRNDPTVSNSADNHHGIIGYLSHPGVADRVAEAIAQEAA